MIRLSIQARQALARLTLPVLIVASFGMMLLGKADTLLADRARITLADGLAPIYAVLATPLARVHTVIAETAMLWDIRAENDRLRAENEKLRRWQSVALALDAENQRLKASLRWIPDPQASFVTARVVADAGGVYAKAVLLSVGPNSGIRKGEIAVDERGLVGRVTEVGTRTARILLITDLNSRIPVTLETSRAHAILVGTNGNRPRLQYWPEGVTPREGERIVTSAEANAFPANLPIGTVHYTGSGAAEVEPAAMLDKLEVVRIFDYGLNGAAAPEPPASQPATSHQPPAGQPPAGQPPAGQPPASQPPASQPPASQPPASQPPATQPSASRPPASQPAASQPPATQPSASRPPASQPAATQPPATQPPASRAPATQPSAGRAPATQSPASRAPATQSPASRAPARQPPASQPSASQPSARQPPASQPSASQPAASQRPAPGQH